MSKLWSIPRMWEEQSCVILAGGGSLTKAVVEAVRTSTFRVIAINNSYKLAPWADMLYAADKDWWLMNKGAPDFGGYKVTCEENAYDDVLQLQIGAMTGFDPRANVLCTGGNSGYQAICVAVHAGCKKILLCGFDMKPGHWHGPHKPPLRETNPSQYATWIERFRTLAQPLADLGVEVINCTPGSALDAFPHGVLADELLHIREVA